MLLRVLRSLIRRRACRNKAKFFAHPGRFLDSMSVSRKQLALARRNWRAKKTHVTIRPRIKFFGESFGPLACVFTHVRDRRCPQRNVMDVHFSRSGRRGPGSGAVAENRS